MKLLRILSCAIVASFPMLSSAADQNAPERDGDWMLVHSDKDLGLSIYANPKMARKSKDEYLMPIRYIDRASITSIRHFAVKQKDCQIGYGKITQYDMSNKVSSNSDWLKGSGTVGSSIAEYLCIVLGG